MRNLMKTLVVVGCASLGGLMMSSASQAGIMVPAKPVAMDSATQQVQWHHPYRSRHWHNRWRSRHYWGHGPYRSRGYWHNHWRSRHWHHRW